MTQKRAASDLLGKQPKIVLPVFSIFMTLQTIKIRGNVCRVQTELFVSGTARPKIFAQDQDTGMFRGPSTTSLSKDAHISPIASVLPRPIARMTRMLRAVILAPWARCVVSALRATIATPTNAKCVSTRQCHSASPSSSSSSFCSSCCFASAKRKSSGAIVSIVLCGVTSYESSASTLRLLKSTPVCRR